MDNKKLSTFGNDLNKLVKKHGLRHAAFCATTPDEEFYGLILGSGGTKMSVVDSYEATLNIGRLWQHARTTVRNSLAAFDRWSASGK